MNHHAQPLILVTNDDGYDSPGILELADHLRHIGDVLLVAPKEHHSGVARGIPFGVKARASGMIEEHLVDISPGVQMMTYAVHGTPAQCSVHGVLEIAPRMPDLCVSGINFGENVGRALNYSGTIGAAIEAADFGIPSIAISQQLNYDDTFRMTGQREIFSSAAEIAVKLAKKIFDNPPSEEFFCVNVNVPHGATVDTSIEITRQSDINRWNWVKPPARDFSQHYSVSYEEVSTDWVPGTDAHALLVNRNVSLTPISWAIDDRSGQYDSSQLEKLTID
jgi:5'-nucleotidase